MTTYDRAAHEAVIADIEMIKAMLQAAEQRERELRESHPDPMMRPSHWKGRAR